jgi:hypothetical protein
MTQLNPTNMIAFGNIAISLEKEQLNYYVNGNLTKVRDVGPLFDVNDLHDLGVNIATKNNLGPVKFVRKHDIVK